MIKETVKIQNKLGLHARAASSFVNTAQEFISSVEVLTDQISANGKSIMNILMLQASNDTEIELIVDGEDETEAMAALLRLINQKFGEEE